MGGVKNQLGFIRSGLIAGGLYFLLGHLSNRLNIDPGYATLVWPPAGLALAAMLLWGSRVIPGLFIGVFAFNIHLGTPVSGALVAVGACLQAYFGYRLVRHLLDDNPPLFQPAQVLKFFTLAGPVSALVNCSWSTAMLRLTGVIGSEVVLQNWLTWWAGDIFGIVVFCPVVLLAFRPEQFGKLRALVFQVTVLGGWLLLLLVFNRGAQLERGAVNSSFKLTAREGLARLEQLVDRATAQVRSLQGFFESSEVVTRKEFGRFASILIEQAHGVRALEWVPRVPGEDRVSHEGKARDEGLMDYRIQEQGPDGMTAADAREEYFPVFYAEPFLDNRAAFGFDLASEPARKTAVYGAVRTGLPAATPPIQLVQDPDGLLAILIMFPVYQAPVVPPDESSRLAAAKGVVLGVYQVDTFAEGMEETLCPLDIRISIRVKSDQGLEPFYTCRCDEGLDEDEAVTIMEDIRVGNLLLEVRLSPSSRFAQNRYPTMLYAMFSFGMIVDALMGMFILVAMGSNQVIRRRVVERTLELMKAKDLAEENSRMKGEFVSLVSHELRTPLTAIKGAVGLLEGAEQNPRIDRNKTIEIARKNTDRLLSLINDLLDMQKLESGVFKLNTEEIDIREFLEKTMEENQPFAREFNASLAIEGQVPRRRLLGDALRLQQVMSNLISNAVKFSPIGGKVSIRVEADDHHLTVKVIDRGRGIPESFRGRIFQKFSQADGSVSREKPGTGLGLSICKAIVEEHQGTIGFTSREGKGSTFYFTLPTLD